MKKIFIGRNGPDQLSQFILTITLLISILNLLLIRSVVFSSLVSVSFVYVIYRMFSKQVYKRRQENIRFMQKLYPYQLKAMKWANRQMDKKTNKHFKCPECKQVLRVPRGRGQITITCPKCANKFDRRT